MFATALRFQDVVTPSKAVALCTRSHSVASSEFTISCHSHQELAGVLGSLSKQPKAVAVVRLRAGGGPGIQHVARLGALSQVAQSRPWEIHTQSSGFLFCFYTNLFCSGEHVPMVLCLFSLCHFIILFYSVLFFSIVSITASSVM